MSWTSCNSPATIPGCGLAGRGGFFVILDFSSELGILGYLAPSLLAGGFGGSGEVVPGHTGAGVRGIDVVRCRPLAPSLVLLPGGQVFFPGVPRGAVFLATWGELIPVKLVPPGWVQQDF